MTRLKDIAARAGVSLMTVSKVLRDAPDISPATKARVRQLVQEMGYVPDSLAQGLRTRTTRLLGLVISNSLNPIFARLVAGIEERTFELGFDLLLGQSLNLPDREDALIQRFLARRVDGFLISPTDRLSPTAPAFEALRSQNAPVVILTHCPPFCSDFHSVHTDATHASATLTRHLLELGHRRIAYFSGPQSSWADQRLDGYRRALRAAQIEPDDHLLFKAGSTVEDGESAALQMMNEQVRPTAIQAVNDFVAIGAAGALLRQGWKIPQDLSIAGFGNIMAAEHFQVPLTTLRQPQLRIGSQAADLLEKLIRKEKAESIHVPCELVIRQSTAPPPPQ